MSPKICGGYVKPLGKICSGFGTISGMPSPAGTLAADFGGLPIVLRKKKLNLGSSYWEPCNVFSCARFWAIWKQQKMVWAYWDPPARNSQDSGPNRTLVADLFSGLWTYWEPCDIFLRILDLLGPCRCLIQDR